MKKVCIIVSFLLLMTGCGAQETFETVEDVYSPQEVGEPKEVILLLPEDAAAQTMEGENGKLYFCDGYELTVETLSSGDLNKTLQTVTGYSRDALTVMQTSVSETQRYECVWTAAGEAGDCVGRAVILDDGSYHYVLSVMASAQEAGSLQETWEQLLSSFSLQS